MDFEEWKRLITSREPADRSDAADVIPDQAKPEEVVPYLITALQDPVELVRTCAADTLGSYHGDDVAKALRAALQKENDPLTKAYVLSSLGTVGELNDLPRFVEALQNETHPQIQVHAALGLAFCATSNAIKQFLIGIEASGAVKTAAANTFGEYLEDLREHADIVVDRIAKELERDDLVKPEREILMGLRDKLSGIRSSSDIDEG